MSELETKKKRDVAKRVAELVDLLISRAINEIQMRAVNLFTALKTLGLSDKDIVSRIETELEGQSDKMFDLFANQAGNVAINEGRYEELIGHAHEIEMFEYSAILDKNTCDPCDASDGQQSVNIDDIPEAPNPECEGGASCRCFVIGIGKETNV